VTRAICYRLWLSRLCRIEVAALERPDVWPPYQPTPDEAEQIAHLESMAAQAGADADSLAGARTPARRGRLWREAMAALGGPS
jgi:hypothetical protein